MIHNIGAGAQLPPVTPGSSGAALVDTVLSELLELMVKHLSYLPESEAYGRSAITLPLYPTLEPAAQDRVIEAVREVL